MEAVRSRGVQPAGCSSFISRTQLPLVEALLVEQRDRAALSELFTCLRAKRFPLLSFLFMDFLPFRLLSSVCSTSSLIDSRVHSRNTHPSLSSPLPPSLNVWSGVSQTRTPRVTRLSPTQPALADQANRVSFASAEHLETMSEPDVPIGFNRMNRLRQSLPLARSSSQAKLRAPGQNPRSSICLIFLYLPL